MSEATSPWVVLVVGNPSGQTRSAGSVALDEPATLLRRARVLASIAKTCCLIAEEFLRPWRAAVRELWPSNVFSLVPGETVLQGVVGGLASIIQREPDANVILIPFNHCAVEEASWLASAAGALRLGAVNRNTVYLLHDNPDNDPRVALQKPEVCTSSVMVGAAAVLMALCLGRQKTTIVDLVVGGSDGDMRAPFTESAPTDDTPLNVVHIRLAEEYARLQRGDAWHRAGQAIDLHV